MMPMIATRTMTPVSPAMRKIELACDRGGSYRLARGRREMIHNHTTVDTNLLSTLLTRQALQIFEI